MPRGMALYDGDESKRTSPSLGESHPYIDSFIIDIKDMNPAIYQAYTGKPNRQVIDNLVWLNLMPNIKTRSSFVPHNPQVQHRR